MKMVAYIYFSTSCRINKVIDLNIVNCKCTWHKQVMNLTITKIYSICHSSSGGIVRLLGLKN